MSKQTVLKVPDRIIDNTCPIEQAVATYFGFDFRTIKESSLICSDFGGIVSLVYWCRENIILAADNPPKD